jgi:hypothetical protein
VKEARYAHVTHARYIAVPPPSSYVGLRIAVPPLDKLETDYDIVVAAVNKKSKAVVYERTVNADTLGKVRSRSPLWSTSYQWMRSKSSRASAFGLALLIETRCISRSIHEGHLVR